MYAPVVMRFNTWQPALSETAAAYARRVTALPAVHAWIDDARRETPRDPCLRYMRMNIYAVGGAIRDELLGVPVQDRDYVVVGATPEQMVAQGYRPVGKDFPVFLHPQTHEEYALARTERKTAAGYHGFQFFYAPDVTLEEDLARRDLTINAMARELRPDGTLTGPVIDPFNGQADLQARVFRHVSDAFLEDPVRILRVARFAARFTDFTVAPETHGTDAQDGGRGRGGCAGAGAGVAGVVTRLDGGAAVADVRGVARVRRACADFAGDRCVVGRAAAG